jgi:FkbH-like protein
MFQSFLLEASRKGVILAICSKNNIEDVQEIFTNNHEMVLKLEHFSCIKANWNLKSENIKEISEELNIGLDSIVFIDDNPMERELVKSFLPEVVVPDFPEHPYQLVNNFLSIYNSNFQVNKLTNEDKVKTEQYLSNNQRKMESLKFSNFEEYLESLNIEIEVYECNDGNIERIAQMTQKTNQFNLTTKRYTIQELQDHKKAGSILACFRVKDKFGDNGITVFSIIEFKEGEAYLDTFLLSCRILGRKIEFAVMRYLENLLYARQIKNFKATFTKTEKNKVSETFLEDAGFEMTSEIDNTKYYNFAIQEKAEIENYYKFIEVI